MSPHFFVGNFSGTLGDVKPFKPGSHAEPSMKDQELGDGAFAVHENEDVIEPIGERVAPGILQFHHCHFPTQQGPVEFQHLPEGGREDHDVDVPGTRKGGRQDVHHGARVRVRKEDDLFVTYRCGGLGGRGCR